jgi:general stress protein 26
MDFGEKGDECSFETHLVTLLMASSAWCNILWHDDSEKWFKPQTDTPKSKSIDITPAFKCSK